MLISDFHTNSVFLVICWPQTLNNPESFRKVDLEGLGSRSASRRTFIIEARPCNVFKAAWLCTLTTAYHFHFVLLFPCKMLHQCTCISWLTRGWLSGASVYKLFILHDTCWWWRVVKTINIKLSLRYLKTCQQVVSHTDSCNTCLLCICSFVFLC